MSIIEEGSAPFEPYARLMNIIGDQLITDKKVAVIEIIKNSYDADAENVFVRFFNLKNFGKTYVKEHEKPFIEIEDDGEGMPLKIIKDVWLRPATPNKLSKKKNKQSFTAKGRIIQGEKGIGRFSIHKLGEKIDLFTKAQSMNEVKLELDFTEFNPEKYDLFNQPPDRYKLLKDVSNKWVVHEVPQVVQRPTGTLIRIHSLRESWNNNDFEDLVKAINRLTPPQDPNSADFNVRVENDFRVKLTIDGDEYFSPTLVKIDDVIERAPFQMKGQISKDGLLNFSYRSIKTNRKVEITIDLFSEAELASRNYDLWAIKQWFKKLDRKPSCGEISFSLYAYDFLTLEKTSDTKELKAFIKDNFVYVFRDGVRVYPFGEQGYDWLSLDKLRSVVKAGQFPSYNDLIGFVYITQKDNPLLRDATNRFGIVNINGAYEDFKHLVTAVTEIFNTESKIDKEKSKIVKAQSFRDSNEVLQKSYNSLKISLEKNQDTESIEKANKFLKVVQHHSELMRDRMQTVEDLAGLGMAVEKASHDALMLLSKMRVNIQEFSHRIRQENFNIKEAGSFLRDLDENLTIVYEEMQVIQPLFKFQRKSIQDVSISEAIEKVIKYFRRDLQNNINVKILRDKDIKIKTNNGLVLQVLINLVDNAVYWMGKMGAEKKELVFKIDSSSKTLIIADSGPGIREEVVPMIFNEFFSLKSDGRGLGLYIVKEILMRIGAVITVLETEELKILRGANIVIKFHQD
jgi:hypothetical protein